MNREVKVEFKLYESVLYNPYIVKWLLGPGCCDKVELISDDRWWIKITVILRLWPSKAAFFWGGGGGAAGWGAKGRAWSARHARGRTFSFPSSCASRSRTKTLLRAPNNACLLFKRYILNGSLDRNGFSSDINKWNEFSLAAALNYRDLLLCCYLGRRTMRIQRRCLTIESSVIAPIWRLLDARGIFPYKSGMRVLVE